MLKDENGKNNSFLSAVMHIGLGTIINMMIGFVTTPIITRMIIPTEYGRLSIFNLYIGIAIMMICLGLDQSLVRFYYSNDNIKYKRWLLRSCVGISLGMTGLCIVAFLVFTSFFGWEFEFSDIYYLFFIGIIGEVLYKFASLVLRLEGDSKGYALSSIFYKSVYVIFAIVLIKLTGDNSFRVLALSMILGYIIATVYAILKTRRIWKPDSEISSYDIKLSEILKYGVPFVFSLGLTTLFAAVDKLSLKYFCDYSVVGVYASATTIIAVFAIVQTSFNAVWVPVSVKHYETDPDDTEFYTKYNQAITIVMFLFGITFILFKDVFGLLLGESYREAAQIVPFLALHPIMYTISETTVTGIVVKKKSYLHLVVAGVSCIFNLIGNIILIPLSGARGAAISTGLSYIVFYVMRTWLGSRFYAFKHYKGRFWSSTILVLIFAIYNTFNKIDAISVVMYFVIVILFCILYKTVIVDLLKLMSRKLLQKKNDEF